MLYCIAYSIMNSQWMVNDGMSAATLSQHYHTTLVKYQNGEMLPQKLPQEDKNHHHSPSPAVKSWNSSVLGMLFLTFWGEKCHPGDYFSLVKCSWHILWRRRVGPQGEEGPHTSSNTWRFSFQLHPLLHPLQECPEVWQLFLRELLENMWWAQKMYFLWKM